MTNPPIRRSRAQYSSRACDECRRRKVKCSGTEPCQSCLDSQTTCQFTHDGQRGRKRALESQNHQRGYRNVRAPQTGGNIQDNHISTLEDDLSHIQDRTTSVNVPEQNMQQQTPQSLPCFDGFQDPQKISGRPNGGNVSDSASPSAIDTENWFGHGSALLGTQKRVLETLSTDNSPNNDTNLSNTEESATGQGQETDDIIFHACALSNNPRLAPLIRLFFTDYNSCFYCLDPDSFVGRLSSLLEKYSSPHGQLQVPSNKPELISLAALACMVLAFAETLVHEAPIAPQDITTCNFSHQMWYTEARRMLELYPKRTPTNMDIVQFHMVATYYAAFLDCISQESGNGTYHAIVMTITSAYSIGLNNEARWSHLSPEERIARKCLWASIDLMDKQIAYKCGWPYLIQESEVLVSDLTKDIKALDESYKCFAINDRKERDETTSGRPNHTSSRVHPSASTALSMPILLRLEYVQSLIEITRAFKRAWRSFFSVRRPADWDKDDVEEIDALLRRIQRNLPLELTWNSAQFSQSSKTWEAMTLHRIRLLLLTRISILRLAIRHASVRGRKGDPKLADRYTAVEIDYTTTVCEEIACTTITALFKYLDRCSPGSCLTTYAASSVLECIYHTVAISQLGLDGGMLKTCQLSDRMIATLAEGVEIFRRTASSTRSQRTNLPKSIVPIIEGIVTQKRHSNRTSTGGNESRSLSSPPAGLPSLKDQLSNSQVNCIFPALDTMPQEEHSSSRDRSIDVDSSYLFDPSLLPAPFLENGRAFDMMNTGFFPSSFEMDFERSLQ